MVEFTSIKEVTQVARCFPETPGGGDLTQMTLPPTWAHGRPAVAICHRIEDRGLMASARSP
jgi:hypothetical protein